MICSVRKVIHIKLRKRQRLFPLHKDVTALTSSVFYWHSTALWIFISFQPCFLVYIGCSPLSISRSAEEDLWRWNNPPVAWAIQRTENFAQVPPKLSSNKEFNMSIPKSKSVLSALIIEMYVQLEAWIMQKILYCRFTRWKHKLQIILICCPWYTSCLCWWSLLRDKDWPCPRLHHLSY